MSTAFVLTMALVGAVDLDRDGVSDALERALVEQFRPNFFVDANDCAGLPVELEPFSTTPHARDANAAIYTRVSPSGILGPGKPALEVHYYHLWEKDCGALASHPLDVERVSALLVPSGDGWTARYWYAAAHEGTVCDTSNAARADVLEAVSSGPDVWISAGKHASYLNRDLCGQRGCGGDQCREMVALAEGPLINLGESGVTLNGAVWTASDAWPFEKKLGPTFHPELVARLELGDDTAHARVNGDLRPTHFSISIGGDTIGAFGTAGKHGGHGVSEAEKHTGRAIGKSWLAVGRALGHATRALRTNANDPER